MKLFITGATGFIGAAVVRLALSKGYQVTAFVRPGSERKLPDRTHPNLTVLHGDLSNPPVREIQRFGADHYLHAAWIATPGVYLESPENDLWMEWSYRFIQAIAGMGEPHILCLGTCIEYGPSASRVSEDSVITPVSRYARCKHRLHEELLRADIPCSWGRVFYPYGPGEHSERFCSALIRKLLRKEPVCLNTPDSIKDYIYIEDLASAILAVLATKHLGAINLATGEGVKIRDIARILAEELGCLDLVEEGKATSNDPYPYLVANPGKLLGLGWKPKTDLSEGLKKLIVSVRSAAS